MSAGMLISMAINAMFWFIIWSDFMDLFIQFLDYDGDAYRLLPQERQCPMNGPDSDIHISADVSSANFDDDVEIIIAITAAATTPKSTKKKPISSLTTKKKRTLKSVTVDKQGFR
jgi:hypothetical protein